MEKGETAPTETARRSSLKRKLTLAVLTAANCSNFWQRNLLYALASAWPHDCLEACDQAVFVPLCERCEEADEACRTCQACRAEHDATAYSLRDASCMSDRQYGLLASVSFTIMFAASGVVAGSIADSLSEARWLHASAVLAWSLASFAKVLSPTFEVLLATRLVLGVAQGFNAPCAYPILVAEFSPAERATANGVYSAGTYLGSALASLSLVAAMLVGWRLATALATLVGLASAAALFLVVDRPRRDLPSPAADPVLCADRPVPSPRHQGTARFRPQPRASTADEHATFQTGAHPPSASPDISVAAAAARVAANPRLALLYLATSLRMTTTVSLWTYLPAYFARAFPRDVVAFSLLYSLGTLLCGSLSSAGGGALADLLVRRGSPAAHGSVPAAGALASVALVAVALYAPTFPAAAPPLLLSILLSECWLGPCMSLLACDAPNAAMGTHVALLLVANQLLAALGPWAVSAQDDGTASYLRLRILQVVAFFSISSAAAFALVGQCYAGPLHDDPPPSAQPASCFAAHRRPFFAPHAFYNPAPKRNSSATFSSDEPLLSQEEARSLLSPGPVSSSSTHHNSVAGP